MTRSNQGPRDINEIARRGLAAGDPTGWFEQLYVAAEGGSVVVPWDQEYPNRLLVSWASAVDHGRGRRALVVGAGLGRDAEYVASLGYDTTAFDISETAVRAARRRHRDSTVRYVVADLLDPPAEWHGAFDLVLESMTVQSLPDPPRADAIANVGRFAAPGGTLLVIAFGADESRPDDGPPWPLVRAEIEAFAVGGLRALTIEDVRMPEEPDIARWRAEFTRP